MTDDDLEEEMNWMLQMNAEDDAMDEEDWPLLRGDA
jgi:hypothetical protein